MTEETSTILDTATIRSHRETHRHWYGYLADDNVEHVGERIRTMLKDRDYVWVANNVEQKRSQPEVRTGQRLKPRDSVNGVDGITVRRIGDPDWEKKPGVMCSISASDTYGLWAVHSHYATEREAAEDARDEAKTKSTVYIAIEGGLGEQGMRNERIEISQYNGYGEMLHWVIAPQQSGQYS